MQIDFFETIDYDGRSYRSDLIFWYTDFMVEYNFYI